MRKTYRVLDKNARFIGGRRVNEGHVDLTDSEADHELRIRSIEQMVEDLLPEDPLDTTEPTNPFSQTPVNRRRRRRKRDHVTLSGIMDKAPAVPAPAEDTPTGEAPWQD